ncbi:MAG: Co2+/Mg2+ efflux protein ApaG [Meiothermus sp.]
MSDLPLRDDIAVSVRVVYAEEHSASGRHVFVYFITITNHGNEIVQLLERQWLIRQSFGEETQVQGEGVVGEKPILEPGQSFEYNSFCPIEHPPGSMEGFYIFQNMLGQRFRVVIPAFVLRLPEAARTLN